MNTNFYMKKTIAQLKMEAKSRGLKGYSKLDKEKLVNLIVESLYSNNHVSSNPSKTTQLKFSLIIKGATDLDTFYWNGKGFSEYEEDAVYYSTDKTVSFVKDNFFKSELGQKVLSSAENENLQFEFF